MSKARDFTDEHRAACVRAKEETGLSDREIAELAGAGELFGVSFPRKPSRQRVNNWTRDAKREQALKGEITVDMLRGVALSELWALLQTEVPKRKGEDRANLLAAILRAGKYAETRARSTTRPKPKSPKAEEQGEGENAPSLDRLREVAANRVGPVIGDASDEGPTSARALDAA